MEKSKFYAPYKDATGRVKQMRYLNNGFSYAILTNGNYALCNSPVLEAVIIEIIFEDADFQKVKHKFLTEVSVIRGY